MTANSVELLVLNPNWEKVRILFLSIKLIILSAIIFSKIFEKIGSNEIGRKSFIDLDDNVLGIGMTMANLKFSGKMFWSMQLLNNCAKNGATISLASLINFDEIPSRPGVVWIFIALIWRVTSSLVISWKTKLWMQLLECMTNFESALSVFNRFLHILAPILAKYSHNLFKNALELVLYSFLSISIVGGIFDLFLWFL